VRTGDEKCYFGIGIQNTTSIEEQNISRCGTCPASLSLVAPFNELYVPKQVNLPKPTTEQFVGESDLDYSSLLSKLF
jgi:hypothetical protein